MTNGQRNCRKQELGIAHKGKTKHAIKLWHHHVLHSNGVQDIGWNIWSAGTTLKAWG